MTIGNVIDTVLIVYGLYTLYGMTAKPDFYWQSRRIQRTRQIMGDKRTVQMYYAIAALTIVVGILGFAGLF